MVRKSIVPGLDFKLKGGRCDLKESCIQLFDGKIKLKGTGKARNQVILLVIHPITPPWVKWNLIKKESNSSRNLRPFPHIKIKGCNWSRSKVKP